VYHGELPDSATGISSDVFAAAGMNLLLVAAVVAAFGLLLVLRLRYGR
jgi:hypothetical protein